MQQLFHQLKLHMISEASLYDSKPNIAQGGINYRSNLKTNQQLKETLEHLDDPDLVSIIEELLVHRAQQRAPDLSAPAPDHV